MAKHTQHMINTSECKDCEYGLLENIDRSKIIVHCSFKNKSYIYGQCIPCESKRKKKK